MKKIGTLCYATRQGLGILAKQFHDNGVITDVLVYQHPQNPTNLKWYPNAGVVTRPFDFKMIAAFVKSVDVMLFFESPFDWDILDLCRKLGTKTAIVTMYEWSPKQYRYKPDLFICPSLLDCEYFPGSPFMQIPAPSEIKWKLRTRARKFLHNGGHLGCRGHKGTLEILRAMQFVKSPIELKVTSQDTVGLHSIRNSIMDDSRVTFDTSDKSYEELFDEGDVFIMAEKFNGLSLPLQEARAAGMLVMTSKRHPMTSWLPLWPLIPVESYHTASVGGGHNDFQEATINPKDIAAKIDEVYDMDIAGYSLSGKKWAEQNSWAALKPIWIKILESI